MSGAETLEVAGQTLYAPTLACRPVQLVGDLWRAIIADVGAEPTHYDDSTIGDCEVCDVKVYVGPRQSAAIDAAGVLGLAAHVYCMVCAVKRTHELAQQSGGEVRLANLGNPQQPQRPKGMA